jgi:hypothetical protein
MKMDKTKIQYHLAQAESHVQLGLSHIAEQHELIVRMDLDGLDTTMAREVLSTFEDIQRSHVADRDRLVRELAEAK